MLNLEIIGKKISEQRKLKKMTQNELAETLFVTHQAVSKWENGKSIPSIEILYEITKLFDVTIDYLLDNSEIDPSDYESQFKHQPREIVIGSFLKSDNPGAKVNLIFYLLSKKERLLIVNMIIQNTTSINVEDIWPYLNNKERNHILGTIMTNKLDYDLNLLWNQLSVQEQRTITHNSTLDTYNYALKYKKFKE